MTIDLTDPRTKWYFRDLLEDQYLAKFLRRIRLLTPRPPGIELPPWPHPGPLSEGADLKPDLSVDINQFLLGDLLIAAIGDPDAQPNKLRLASQIKESKLHIEVVSDLLKEFKEGVVLLEAELAQFQGMPGKGA